MRRLRLADDKGYDAPWIRDWLRSRRISTVISEKRKPYGRKTGRPLVLDTATYHRRNVIERSISWLNRDRRIATRFEKLALYFVAILKQTIIQHLPAKLLARQNLVATGTAKRAEYEVGPCARRQEKSDFHRRRAASQMPR